MADPRTIQGFLTGFIPTNASDGQLIAALVAVAEGQIRNVACACTTSGGSGTTIVDVQINNQSLWTDPANRPTLTGGAAGRFTGGVSPNRRAIRIGDIVRILVVTAGSRAGIVATVALEEPQRQPPFAPSF